MAAGKLEAYYWEVYALIFESGDILSLGDPDFSLSDADTASIEQAIHAVLPFRDHSRLYAEILLAEDGETIEERYAYIYYDAGGERLLQYDNRIITKVTSVIQKSRHIHITCTKGRFPFLARKTVHGRLISSL